MSVASIPGRPEFNRAEASAMLESLSLTSFFRGDYIIVTRPDFDVTISGEPYIALMLFYNIKSGKYLARLWNKTLDSGGVMNLDHLAVICERHFLQIPLCLGCPESEKDVANCAFFVSQSPFPRKISRACSGFIGESSTSNSTICNECANLSSPENIKEEAMDDDVEETFEEDELAPLSPYVEEENDPTQLQEGEVDHNDPTQLQGSDIDHNLYPHWEELDAQSTAQQKDVACNECNKVFKNKRSWYSHMKEKHAGAPQVHLCPMCGASFGRKSNMKAHMRGNCKLSKMQIQEATSGSFTGKPPFTYSQLIVEALRSADGSTLGHSEICQYISNKYPYYRMKDKEWQICIKKRLGKDKMFEPVDMLEGNPNPRRNKKGTWAPMQVSRSWRIKDEKRASAMLSKTEQLSAKLSKTQPQDATPFLEPPLTYSQLIVEALRSAEDSTLRHSEICQYVSNKYPYYRLEDKNWQHSIGQHLGRNSMFEVCVGRRHKEGEGDARIQLGRSWRLKDDQQDNLGGSVEMHDFEPSKIEPAHLNNIPVEPRLPQQPAGPSTEENLEQGDETYDQDLSQNVASETGIKVEPAMDEEDTMPEALEDDALQMASSVKVEYEDQDQSLEPLGTEWSEEGDALASTSQKQHANYYESGKPPFTFAQLILQALMTEKDSGLPLCEIYSFISQKYPFYKLGNKTWQNAIRHNLTLNEGFEKVINSNEGRRGNCWRMKPGFNFKGIINRKIRVKSSYEFHV